MPKLSLYHQQGDTFTRHLDRVSMPELMVRSEPAADPGHRCSVVQLGADPG